MDVAFKWPLQEHNFSWHEFSWKSSIIVILFEWLQGQDKCDVPNMLSKEIRKATVIMVIRWKITVSLNASLYEISWNSDPNAPVCFMLLLYRTEMLWKTYTAFWL